VITEENIEELITLWRLYFDRSLLAAAPDQRRVQLAAMVEDCRGADPDDLREAFTVYRERLRPGQPARWAGYVRTLRELLASKRVPDAPRVDCKYCDGTGLMPAALPTLRDELRPAWLQGFQPGRVWDTTPVYPVALACTCVAGRRWGADQMKADMAEARDAWQDWRDGQAEAGRDPELELTRFLVRCHAALRRRATIGG